MYNTRTLTKNFSNPAPLGIILLLGEASADPRLMQAAIKVELYHLVSPSILQVGNLFLPIFSKTLLIPINSVFCSVKALERRSSLYLPEHQLAPSNKVIMPPGCPLE